MVRNDPSIGLADLPIVWCEFSFAPDICLPCMCAIAVVLGSLIAICRVFASVVEVTSDWNKRQSITFRRALYLSENKETRMGHVFRVATIA